MVIKLCSTIKLSNFYNILWSSIELKLPLAAIFRITHNVLGKTLGKWHRVRLSCQDTIYFNWRLIIFGNDFLYFFSTYLLIWYRFQGLECSCLLCSKRLGAPGEGVKINSLSLSLGLDAKGLSNLLSKHKCAYINGACFGGGKVGLFPVNMDS